MVVRVHDGAADGRSPAHVALAAGLADLHILVVDVADLADGGHAGDADVAQLAGRQSEQREAVLLRHELSHVAGGAGELSALAGIKLNVVDEGTNRDAAERKRVAGLNVRVGAGDDNVADLQAVRSDDIALLAVLVLNESDECASVWIVLECEYICDHIVLITLKVDDTILSSVSDASVANSDSAVAISSRLFLHRFEQALFRLNLRQL